MESVVYKKKRLEGRKGSPSHYQEASPQPTPTAPHPTLLPMNSRWRQRPGAGLGYLRQMDPSLMNSASDQCLDNFLRSSMANRDMSVVRTLFTDEMFGILQKDANDPKQKTDQPTRTLRLELWTCGRLAGGRHVSSPSVCTPTCWITRLTRSGKWCRAARPNWSNLKF